MGPQEYFKKMKDFFDISKPQQFYDPLFLRHGKIRLDVVKFDDWLHEKVGNYEDDGKNMKDAIIENFGVDAGFFIEILL